MDKKNNIPEILITVGIVVVFVAGYYAVKFMLADAPLEMEKSAILDTRTGIMLTKAQVNAIAQKQELDMATHTLGGKITLKLRDSLQVAVVLRNKTRLVQVKFAPTTVFLKNISATEEKEISFDGVNVGDNITMVFPQGILLREVAEMGVLVTDNLTVDMPPPPGIERD